MRFAAEIVATGFLAWICAGLAVTSFLFRRNRCHRSQAVADFDAQAFRINRRLYRRHCGELPICCRGISCNIR
jgi:hypothetical protein